jgi:hypothetical protein
MAFDDSGRLCQGDGRERGAAIKSFRIVPDKGSKLRRNAAMKDPQTMMRKNS